MKIDKSSGFMRNTTYWLLIAMTGLAVASSAQARPTLTEMDFKLDQILANQEQMLQILTQQGATCAELEFEGTIWTAPAKGVDLRGFTNSTLHFIGCAEIISADCRVADFFCISDAQSRTLTFGATSGVVRALVDPGDAFGQDMTGERNTATGGCATSEDPNGIANAPVTDADARALCRALGYDSGSVEVVDNNFCPKPQSLDPTGGNWGSDFLFASGYGQVFTCQ